MRREHPKMVQSLLGHYSITQKMDTYSHLMDGIGNDTMDGLDEASDRQTRLGGVKMMSKGL
jgi:hypothetical protein